MRTRFVHDIRRTMSVISDGTTAVSRELASRGLRSDGSPSVQVLGRIGSRDPEVTSGSPDGHGSDGLDGIETDEACGAKRHASARTFPVVSIVPTPISSPARVGFPVVARSFEVKSPKRIRPPTRCELSYALPFPSRACTRIRDVRGMRASLPRASPFPAPPTPELASERLARDRSAPCSWIRIERTWRSFRERKKPWRRGGNVRRPCSCRRVLRLLSIALGGVPPDRRGDNDASHHLPRPSSERDLVQGREGKGRIASHPLPLLVAGA